MAVSSWLRGPPIGHGSTATVYLATAPSSGAVFAVKSAELSRSTPLRREQSILTSISSPAVVSCLGFDVAAGVYNLFLEYAPGGSLAEHIKKRGGAVGDAAVASHTRHILAGLDYLHGRGVVHCDIKPGNILLWSDGRAKIGDLGCARWLAGGGMEVRGTPMYMPPEAARGEEQGASADVWALGCTVIEMITGRPPWPDAADAAAAVYQIGFSGSVPEIPAWASEEARDFLGKCLRRDPAERWSARDLLRHPFVAISSCAEGCWVSPKSTLDLSMWESMEEEDDEADEFCDEELQGRIMELAATSGGPNWDSDEDWMVVRGGGGESVAEEDAIVGRYDREAGIGGSWIADGGVISHGGEDIVLCSINMGSYFCYSEKKEEKSCAVSKMASIGSCNGDCYYLGLSNSCSVWIGDGILLFLFYLFRLSSYVFYSLLVGAFVEDKNTKAVPQNYLVVLV